MRWSCNSARKPILKKALGEVGGDVMPDSESRNFRGTEEKFTYAVKGHAVDLLNENSKDEADEGTKQHLRTQAELTTKDTKYHQGMPTGRVPW
jgi:hypothetical protein